VRSCRNELTRKITAVNKSFQDFLNRSGLKPGLVEKKDEPWQFATPADNSANNCRDIVDTAV
jgi:hypothetical protein